MKKVFIVHGFNGEPNGGWRPWLMGELAKHDIYACALPMPKPDVPSKESWVKTISIAVENPNEEIFLVGHSLGVPAILGYLETLALGLKIGGVVLVSGIIHVVSDRDKPSLINHFFDKDFNYEKIKNICSNFVVIHGDDDQNVPFSQAIELSQNLSCELVPVPDGKHLNGSAGFYQLPELLESLLKMIK
jgi:hypothetical protein